MSEVGDDARHLTTFPYQSHLFA